MATVQEFVERALEMIGRKDPDDPDTSSADLAAGLEHLNDMMLEWDAEGIWLGYSVVSQVTDEVTVPDWSARAVKSNLALDLCDHFRVQPTISLIGKADTGKRLLVAYARKPHSYRMPSTMPRGAGSSAMAGDDSTSPYFAPAHLTEIGTPNGGILLDENANQLSKDQET